ncbi:transposase [Bacillus cereus]|nr:transposase [Bacillus cereus]
METYGLEVEKSLVLIQSLKENMIWYLITEDDIPLYEVNRYLNTASINSPLTGESYAYKMLSYLRFLKANYQIHYKDVYNKEVMVSYVKYLLFGDEDMIHGQGRHAFQAIKQRISVIKEFYDWLEGQDELKDTPIICRSNKNNYGHNTYLKKKFLYGQIYNFRIEKNIVTKALKYGEQYNHIKWFEDHEVDQIQSFLPTIRDKIISKILFETGARIGEVLGIHLEHLDLEKGVIRVVKTPYNRNKARAKTTQRDLYISETLASEIANYMRGERVDADIEYAEYLFLNHKGKTKGRPVEQRNFLAIFKRAASKAGFDKRQIRTHSGRSTHAQKLLEELYEHNVTEGYILQQMGWKDISTIKPYTRAYNEKNRGSVAKKIIERRIHLPPIDSCKGDK